MTHLNWNLSFQSNSIVLDWQQSVFLQSVIGLCPLFVDTLWPDETFSIVGLEMTANFMMILQQDSGDLYQDTSERMCGRSFHRYEWRWVCSTWKLFPGDCYLHCLNISLIWLYVHVRNCLGNIVTVQPTNRWVKFLKLRDKGLEEE